VTEWISTRREV